MTTLTMFQDKAYKALSGISKGIKAKKRALKHEGLTIKGDVVIM